MIEKCISGGQSGADLAGLDAALEFEINTGGTMPFGFKALNEEGQTVNHPEYAKKYGVKSDSSSSYAVRTRKNVKDSDGTIRLAFKFDTRGEVCTLKSIILENKPNFDVDLSDPCPVDDVIDWIKENNIQILNVAGNSESTHKGTYEAAKSYLTEVFSKLERQG